MTEEGHGALKFAVPEEVLRDQLDSVCLSV